MPMRAKAETAGGLIMMMSLAVMAMTALYVLCFMDFTPKNAHETDFQRGWNAAAAAYRFDYARGVVEGQHRALAAHCVGPMEAPSE